VRTDDDADRHREALARFKLCADAEQDQRDREDADLRFQIPEYQWPDDVRQARQGSTIGNATLPPRPMLSISKLDQPIQLIVNQEKQAQLGVQIHAIDALADDKTAEVIQGIYRRIETDSKAEIARSWAFERAVKAGRGWWEVRKEYDPYGGHWTDQKLVIKRIKYQASVYADPFAEEADRSDMLYAFKTADLRWDVYKARYPASKLARFSDQDFATLGDQAKAWVTGDGPGRAIRIAQYWRVEVTTKRRVLLDDGSDSYEDAIPEGRAARTGDEARSREDEIRRVFVSTINAAETLEPDVEWDGHYIPLIFCPGRELQPFEGDERFVGLISGAKDGQRLYNYAASSAVEMAALEPKAPFVGAEGQFEGHESQWQQINVRAFPFVEYKPTTIAGQVMPPPARAQIDAGRLGPSMELLQLGDQFIQAATATFDPSLGRLPTKDRSGRAILALQEQGNAGTGDFLFNLAHVAMLHEACVILDLIPAVYDRPGRIARIVDVEDHPQLVMLNAPFVPGSGPLGRPQALPNQNPYDQQLAQQRVSNPQDPAQLFDLRKGRYGVTVSVGKSFQTRSQEGAAVIGDVLQTDPALMPWIGDLYFKYADFPGHMEISKRLEKMHPPQLAQSEHGQPDPAQQQQQMAMMGQQLQMLQQQLGQAAEIIRTEQVKQQAQVQIKQAEYARDVELQRMKDATSIAVAEIQAAAKGAVSSREAVHEAIALAQEQRLEAEQAHHDRTHELMLQAQQQAHEQRMGLQDAVLTPNPAPEAIPGGNNGEGEV